MKKSVRIEGLDCPNCARALEGELNKIDGVNDLKIDFVKSKMTFESEETEKSLQQIISITKQVEPNAKIIAKSENHNAKRDKQLILDIILLILGGIIGCCALFIELPLWAFWTLFVVSALLLGYKTYYKAVVLLFKGVINENLLLTLSVIGATAIGEHMEGLMVIFLYSIGKVFEGLAVDKSRKSIEKLTNMQPEYAVLYENEQEEKVSPDKVKVGSMIVVKPGERVPIDGIIEEGKASLDTQSLTGESRAFSVEKEMEILSGSIVLDGVLYIKTTREYENSTVSKIMNLIENASEKKSKTETLISKITKWYTLGVIVLSLLVWGIVWAVTSNFDTALYRGLIFLVVSCPCAFAISVPLTYFSGIGNASRKGILIKGSNYLDACAKLNTIAFDKTGTLTSGVFSIEKVTSFDDSLTEEDIVYIASLGEQNSLHPLAKSILSYNKRELTKVEQAQEIAGEGVEFVYDDKHYFVGRKNRDTKNTLVEVYQEDKKLGEIELSDTIKDNAIEACHILNEQKVKTVMLSGDNSEIVSQISHKLGIAEAHAQMLPQDKYKWIEDTKKDKNAFVGYVGDGINDAPSLMLTDVGISMGINGSPASVEASDIVLVDDNILKVPTAIKISKYTRKIVWENIIISAGVKFVFLLLGALGITGMLSAVFADVGVTLLAVLNSMRALYYNPSKKNKIINKNDIKK